MWTVACGGCRRCPLRGANPGGLCAADARSGVPTRGARARPTPARGCRRGGPCVVQTTLLWSHLESVLEQRCPSPVGSRARRASHSLGAGGGGSRAPGQGTRGAGPMPRRLATSTDVPCPGGGHGSPARRSCVTWDSGWRHSVSRESPVRFACRCFALWGTPLTPVTGPQLLPMRGPGAACEQPQEEGGLAVPAPLVAHAPPPCDERPHWSRPLVCPSGVPARPVLSGKDARSLAPRQGLPLASGSQGTKMNRSEPERARATWAEWLQAVRPRPSSGATTSSSAAGPPLPCAPARPCHLLARRLAPCQPPHYSCEPGERGSGLAGE